MPYMIVQGPFVKGKEGWAQMAGLVREGAVQGNIGGILNGIDKQFGRLIEEYTAPVRYDPIFRGKLNYVFLAQGIYRI